MKQDTRVERRNAILDGQTFAESDQFQKQCLAEVSDVVVRTISEGVQEQIKNVEDVIDEKDGYLRSVQLLNRIVDLLKQHVPEAYGTGDAVIFIANPNDFPRHHPCDYRVRPDILALPERIQEQLQATPSSMPSWHHLLSVGEWNAGSTISDADTGQEREYVACATQARPDNPSVLGVIMCPGGYILSWGSPCGYLVTEQLAFANIAPLVRYVHSLQVRPKSINLADPAAARTIVLDHDVSLHDEPRWRITDPLYKIDNQSFSVVFVGLPFGRMTTVFISVDDGGCTVIKIVYMPHGKSQREGGLFEALGVDPPGWAIRRNPTHDAADFSPSSALDFRSSSFTWRTRVWLVFETTGDAFEKCDTLSEAVGVIYDVLEANRWAIVKRRVLHRDISPRNILIHPKPPSISTDGACFIQGVYEGVTNSASLSILHDLDNGVKLPPSDLSLKKFHGLTGSDSRELKALSGTPMYIARGPSLGEYRLAMSRTFGALPEITPSEASKLYVKAYPNDTFRNMQGSIGHYDETLHEECEQDLSHTLNLIQRPWHDAESAMLVFLIFLLRCKPIDSDPDTDEQLYPMQSTYRSLREATIGTVTDSRMTFLIPEKKVWSKMLHAGLRHVVPFVLPLCKALEVDYEFLIPAQGVNREVVLHEIFQRILFGLYYKLRKGEVQDVMFDTSVRRPIVKSDDIKTVQSVDLLSSSKYGNERLKRKDGPNDIAHSRRNRQSQKRPRLDSSTSSQSHS